MKGRNNASDKIENMSNDDLDIEIKRSKLRSALKNENNSSLINRIFSQYLPVILSLVMLFISYQSSETAKLSLLNEQKRLELELQETQPLFEIYKIEETNDVSVYELNVSKGTVSNLNFDSISKLYFSYRLNQKDHQLYILLNSCSDSEMVENLYTISCTFIDINKLSSDVIKKLTNEYPDISINMYNVELSNYYNISYYDYSNAPNSIKLSARSDGSSEYYTESFPVAIPHLLTWNYYDTKIDPYEFLVNYIILKMKSNYLDGNP